MTHATSFARRMLACAIVVGIATTIADDNKSFAAAEACDLNSALPSGTNGWVEVARSVGSRPIRYQRVGKLAGPTYLWVGGIHGNEPQGRVASEHIAEVFLSSPLAQRASLAIVEDLNPDGRAAQRRTNNHGVDLNRNFAAKNFTASKGYGPTPLSEPESCALARVLNQLRPTLTIVAHAHSSLGPAGATGSRYKAINFDGPAYEAAKVFSDHAVGAVYEVIGKPPASRDYPDPTPGSLGQWWGVDSGNRLLTIEWSKLDTAEQAWDETRGAMIAVFDSEARSKIGNGLTPMPTVTLEPPPKPTTTSATDASTPPTTHAPPTDEPRNDAKSFPWFGGAAIVSAAVLLLALFRKRKVKQSVRGSH